MATATQEFGKWRAKLWPIHTFELKKLLPMAFLFFFILFNYTILRDTKDSLIVNSNAGAEAITFLKVWGVLPMAFLFMLMYAKLSNRLSKTKLFYTSVIPFIIFFALFAYVIYPNLSALQPNELADRLLASSRPGLRSLIEIFRNWPLAIFYVLSELWGSVGISLLFWGFANDITKTGEAKRFYAIFGMFANLSLIISGQVVSFCSKARTAATAVEGVDAWQSSLNYLMAIVVVNGIIAMLIYNWINKKVLTDPRFAKPEEEKKPKKSKPKLSMKESFQFLIRSKYLGYIAILVISYGICINLVEVTWKGQLKEYFAGDKNAYNAFMGNFSTVTGIVTILFIYVFGKNAMGRIGWTKTAQITPVVLLITGAAFLSFIIFKENFNGMAASLGTTTLALAVVFGMTQNFLSKACKYSFFDPTKESAYIPLDQESKVKGKAAVDVVGARLGKSGGALIQQGLIIGFGSLSAVTPLIGVLVVLFVGAWMVAAKGLGKQYDALILEKEGEAAEQKPAAATA
jgi:AAA family ATP:ADP antiporter